MPLGERLRAGETVFSAWSAIPDPVTLEALSLTAFEAVTLDMQHGGHSEESVLRCIAPVMSARKPALVRIPVGRFDMASRALDFGAEAVIAPMVNSVNDAKAFAAAMKYPPLGERSWGPVFAMGRAIRSDGNEWLANANRTTLAFAMIETRAALDILDDILAEPGIDGVFVGPSDFSIAWSDGASLNPTRDDMMETIDAIAKRASEAGKHAAIYVVDPGYCGRFAAMGYRLIALGSEAVYMAAGSKVLLNSANESILQKP